MRTTIDLPDPLFRQAKARAALDGMTFKALITRFVAQGLRQSDGMTFKALITRFVAQGLRQSGQEPPQSARRRRSEPPIARAATGQGLPVFSSAELHQILDED